MSSAIVVHPDFDAVWPFAADHFRALWQAQEPVEFHRLAPGDTRPISRVLAEPAVVRRLVALGARFGEECGAALSGLREAALSDCTGVPAGRRDEMLRAAGVLLYEHPSEGFWGQSVAEMALGLTLCALRRIPQTYHAMLASHDAWDYGPPGGVGRPGTRGQQFGDDPQFTNGTVEGKRVRVAGIGNIGSRYAGFARALGADVAAWDPYACEPAFHRAGARKLWHLDQLVADAEVFAATIKPGESARGVIAARHVDALPQGCLVVLVTRTSVIDMTAVRRRVLADELALAADVFDVEPLPLDDPLLGRHNVVHTPHNAGRTREANHRWAEALAAQFLPPPGVRTPPSP